MPSISVKQIQAQIDELKAGDLSLPNIRKAFESWRAVGKHLQEPEKSAHNFEVRSKLRELDRLCSDVLCVFCEQRKIDTKSVKRGQYKGDRIMPGGRRQWEEDADLIAMAIRTEEAAPQGVPTGAEVGISKNDELILGVLLRAGSKLLHVEDVGRELRLAKAGLSDVVIKNTLGRLIKRGLAHRPQGERKGATLTGAGKSAMPKTPLSK
jgi:hypothetical protein